MAGTQLHYADRAHAPEKAEAMVVVDAGHGFNHGNIFDSGTTKGKAYESDITMVQAKAVAAELLQRGYQVVLTRDDRNDVLRNHSMAQRFDTYCQALAHRVQVAAKASQVMPTTLFVSLHVDSSPTKRQHGMTVFHAPDDARGKKLNDEVSAALASGTKDKRLPVESMAQDLFVLRWNKALNIPALLVEMGFATDKQDMQRMLSEAGRADFAKNIADGVSNFLHPKPRKAMTVVRP